MNALRLADSPTPDPAPRTDQVTAWLDLLVSLLRIPAAERQSVRDELEDHLRQRVRDLILAGEAEPAAVKSAISELGDAAALAQNLTQARNAPKRRKLMAFAATGFAALAAITGITVLSQHGTPRVEGQPSSVPVSVFQPIPDAESSRLAAAKVTARENTNLVDLLEFAGKALSMPVTVRWSALQSCSNLSPDSKMSEAIVGLSVPELVAFINEQFGTPAALDFRIVDGRLVFSSVQNFDRAETILVTYDLHDIVANNGGLNEPVTEEAIKVMTSVVYPDSWRENGGDAASLARFGSKLFITAPKRVHEKIRWVLSEMKPAAPHAMLDPRDDRAALNGRPLGKMTDAEADARAQAAVADAEKDRANAALATLRAADVKVIPLAYCQAAELAPVLASMVGANSVPPTGVSINADARTNSLLVKAPKDRLELIGNFIAFLDTKVQADIARTPGALNMGAGKGDFGAAK